MITKLYAQTDPRWKSQLLGFNTDPRFNIGGYGCLVAAFGNMLCAITGDMSYTPEFINNYMKQHGGFMPDGGLFIWNEALSLGHVEAHGSTTNLAAVNDWLKDPPNFAILQVRASRTLQHFVMAPYVDKIVDSEDGLLKNMGTYPFINARLYRSTDKVNEPATPAPAARPTSGTVKITSQIDGKPVRLNLRTGPGTNFPIGKGKDGNGNVIYSLPNGAEVEYVNVVDANPGSAVKGPWLVSDRKNYFAASGTDYK